jgi:chlorobactene glucosyltransferase
MPDLLLLSFFPLIIFAVTAVLNAFTFPRLSRKPESQIFKPSNPELSNNELRISILIPMRNEAGIIAETVRSLLAQNSPNLEIILLDDNSTDNSAAIARVAANGDPRLRVIPGAPLPPGWTGKVWACHQLSEQAAGETLLFTDADVRWQADAVSALVAEARRTNADLLTVWPTQITQTWGERLVVPLMSFAILAYLPILAVHHVRWPVFAAANGQCLLFRRETYQKIGGHAAIKNQIVDDMAFAYAVKRNKLRLRMADANDLIQTRMYQTWPQARDGFAKNILVGHGNSIILLSFSAFFHWWLFIVPWFLLFVALITRPSSLITEYWTLVTACCSLVTLSVTTRALTAAITRQRIRDAFLMPVSVFLMTLIAFQSIRWHFTGGPQWKGRTIIK